MEQLIADYADGYVQLKKLAEGLSEEGLNYKPANGGWSIKEILLHICDSELVFVHRFKMVISEEAPPLTAFDQDDWSNRLHYASLDLNLHLELFGLLRESMLPILSRLQPEDWLRTGIHNTDGPVSLKELIGKAVRHLTQHAGQVQRVKAEYEASSRT